MNGFRPRSSTVVLIFAVASSKRARGYLRRCRAPLSRPDPTAPAVRETSCSRPGGRGLEPPILRVTSSWSWSTGSTCPPPGHAVRPHPAPTTCERPTSTSTPRQPALRGRVGQGWAWPGCRSTSSSAPMGGWPGPDELVADATLDGDTECIVLLPRRGFAGLGALLARPHGRQIAAVLGQAPTRPRPSSAFPRGWGLRRRAARTPFGATGAARAATPTEAARARSRGGTGTLTAPARRDGPQRRRAAGGRRDVGPAGGGHDADRRGRPPAGPVAGG